MLSSYFKSFLLVWSKNIFGTDQVVPRPFLEYFYCKQSVPSDIPYHECWVMRERCCPGYQHDCDTVTDKRPEKWNAVLILKIYKLPEINRTSLIHLIYLSRLKAFLLLFLCYQVSDKINNCPSKRLCLLFKINISGSWGGKKNCSLKVLDQCYQEGEPLLKNKKMPACCLEQYKWLQHCYLISLYSPFVTMKWLMSLKSSHHVNNRVTEFPCMFLDSAALNHMRNCYANETLASLYMYWCY